MSTLVALKQVLSDLRVDPALAHNLADDASVLTDVGLDSLELLQFMLEIEAQLAVRIDFEQLDYCHLDSIASLAAYLDAMPRSDAAVTTVSSSAAPVTILTSGVGLGTYVPALCNHRALRDAGRQGDVEIIEDYFTEESLRSHLAHADAFRESFELALLARRMTKDTREALDTDRIDALLDSWAQQDRDRFIVWSGFWFSVLQRYITRATHLRVHVDLCRIDAEVSASFRIQAPLAEAECREIWLWNWARRTLDWQIPTGSESPLPIDERERRLVVHGGGWGLGTYLEVLPDLAAVAGYALDVISPAVADWPGRRPSDRRFVPQPGWHPWQRDPGGELAFPPLAEVDADGGVRYLPNARVAPAHGLVREAVAVVSKPGGGTLIDSLSAASLVVLLDPAGDAEARNGDLWEQLGLGIGFHRWRSTGFDFDVLAEMHDNLLAARASGREYPAEVERVAA